MAFTKKDQFLLYHPLHKKWSFPLRISSVNVTKSAVSFGFCHIDKSNPRCETSFFVQWSFFFEKVAIFVSKSICRFFMDKISEFWNTRLWCIYNNHIRHKHCVKHARIRCFSNPIFSYKDRIVDWFCPYTGICGSEKIRILQYFQQCKVSLIKGWWSFHSSFSIFFLLTDQRRPKNCPFPKKSLRMFSSSAFIFAF